jgi:hypothetical protein
MMDTSPGALCIKTIQSASTVCITLCLPALIRNDARLEGDGAGIRICINSARGEAPCFLVLTA